MLNEIASRTRPCRDDAGQVPGGSDIQTPFADEVLRLRRTRPLSAPIVSFHALPWGQGRNRAGAGPIGEKYRQLFGEALRAGYTSFITRGTSIASQVTFDALAGTLSPATAFLIDEAWSAISTFHPSLRPLTALDAAHRIAAVSGTPITLVTQPAHN